MKLLTLAAACAALVTLAAAPAFAADDVVTAKLQTPVAAKTKFIAGGAMFVCEADACVAQAPTSATLSTSTCKAVAAKVGGVISFGGFKPLDEARLRDCNALVVARANSAQLAKQ